MFEYNENPKEHFFPKIVSLIQENPVFKNFYYISTRPEVSPSVSLLPRSYVEEIVTSLLNFVECIRYDQSRRPSESKIYGRYVHKLKSAPKLTPSYLFFTQSTAPGFVFCLIKSNTHIIDEHKNYWLSGGVKQVKTHALVLKFEIKYLLPAEHFNPATKVVIRPVVTFSRPKKDFLNPEEFAAATSIQERMMLKATAMETLLGTERFKSDFSDWTVLHFEDVLYKAPRIVAFQRYFGHDLKQNRDFFSLPCIIRLKSILTLLVHFSEIIHTQRIWPRDIKPENICVFPVDTVTYQLSFIDFKSPSTMTNSILRSTKVGSARSSNYFHPSYHISKYSIDDLRNFAFFVDSRPLPTHPGYPKNGWSNSERLKLAAYHVCFELSFLIFQILYGDRFTPDHFDQFINSFHLEKPFQKIEQFEISLLKTMRLNTQQGHSLFYALYDLPMYKTLKTYIYEQFHFCHPGLSVSVILHMFFNSLKIDFLNYLRIIETTLDDKHKPLSVFLKNYIRSSTDETDPLSDAWITRLAKAFENIPNTEKVCNDVKINQLSMI